MKKKKQTSYFFVGVFVAMVVLVVVQNLFHRQQETRLLVENNAGVSVLETADESLVCVFQDGRGAVWQWGDLTGQRADIDVQTNRVVLLNNGHLAAINQSDKKFLSVYSLPACQKQNTFSVGWEDQDVWPRISPNKNAVALIRKNQIDSAGKVIYEFLTADIEKELTGVPTLMTLQADRQEWVDYAVDDSEVLYAVGSNEKAGRVAAVDLKSGTVLWDRTYDQTKEFSSVLISPDNQSLLAGNRDGVLDKLDVHTGDIVKPIQLLEEGETRPITNDYSVLNAAFSPDGRYYVVTIHPKAYIFDAVADTVIHTFSPADKLVSKIAFSPDSRFIATSDIRAGYPVKIYPMQVENQ